MLGIHEIWLFVLSGLLLNITPGPDTAYIIGRSIQLGWRGGAAAAIGICTGCLVHVFGAAIGLSALLMASSAAFTVVKVIGAAYLVITGLQMLLSRAQPWPADKAHARFEDRTQCFDVIVPAHDEAASVASVVEDLQRIDWPRDRFRSFTRRRLDNGI